MSGRPTLLGLPYDAGSSFLRGAAEAPGRIRNALASASTNLWTEALQDLGSPGTWLDAGDLALPPSAEARTLIESGVTRVLENGGVPICLGGDHSVAHPIVRAVARRHAGLTLLQVDAHPDLYEVFEGDRHSHACPFARILEEGLVRRLVQVGIRTMSAHQRAQADRFGVEVLDMRAWAAGARPELSGPLYVSIDLDGLDPACAPGVSHPEPGGLTMRELLTLLQSLPTSLVGADVVELNPTRDVHELTARVAAKLVKELASRMLEG
jgi:agmatinase